MASQVEQGARQPWGFWITSLVALIEVVLSYTILGLNFGLKDPAADAAASLLSSAMLSLGIAFLFIRLRPGPFGLLHYVGDARASWKQWAFWLLAGGLFAAACTALEHVLDRPPLPDYLGLSISGLPGRVMVVITVSLVAPFAEEIFYRGFLFPGWSRAIQPLGVVILISLVWAFGHGQYDLFNQALVVGAGLLLGIARWKTGSIFVPLVIHILWNAVSLIQQWHHYGG